MKKLFLSILIAVALVILPAIPAFAATTADVSVTATPAFIAITDNVTSYDFGVVATSSTTQSNEDWVGITNTSTVQTDMTIAVTGDWTGGVGWTHDNAATPGADTAGMKSNRGGTWGVSDVIVETLAGSPNYIYENCPATTNYTYGIQLLAPTSFTDGVQKANTVRVTAAAG